MQYTGIIQRDYASVNGLKIYYEIHGDSASSTQTPLVLLHGGGSTLDTSFGKILPMLARNRKVLAFDQQGHGRTADIADRPFSFAGSAKDTVGLLRYLNIPKADVMGFSNGGHIAIQIAISYPQVIRRLIIESAMFSREGAADQEFWSLFPSAKLEMMPQELRDEYVRVAPHPENLESFFEKGVERMMNFKGWTSEEMKSIQMPTLVLIGDRDVTSPEHAVLMFRLIPNSQLCVLPDTDHMTIGSSPLIPAIVGTFLDQPNDR